MIKIAINLIVSCYHIVSKLILCAEYIILMLNDIVVFTFIKSWFH